MSIEPLVSVFAPFLNPKILPVGSGPLSTGLRDVFTGKAFEGGGTVTPQADDPAVDEARRRQRIAAAGANRGGTLLTSGRGVQDNVLLGSRTLLGQ